ncbi:hypothetical protein CDAR_536081 [Caerostris darwini]|uniref:Uncharacterized protein n=1 Tax=Caerostris darwini TaxID=1538125 RepID=A0AAV4QUS0_9ARAC|nr:hypothetical protein CDAR_536081 [Caerostris darwini]
MLMWIQSFLCTHLILCKFHNKISSYKQLRQGLPQVAVLSCLLFNIMILGLKFAIKIIGSIVLILCLRRHYVGHLQPLRNQSTRHFVTFRNGLI